MIYVNLVGRIGNQLFIYAMAEALRQKRGRSEKIVFYDEAIFRSGWVNSLKYYNLNDVEFVHEFQSLPKRIKGRIRFCERLYRRLSNMSYKSKYRIEKGLKNVLLKFGIILCENGYLDFKTPPNDVIFISGYFQSERYFADYKSIICKNICLNGPIREKYSSVIEKLEKRNSICISIKVEHNIGSALYDVCNMDYYRKAISYICEKVKNPFFFICSDNVDYVLNNLLNIKKGDYMCQNNSMPVHENLQIMSYCKHFILSNTSYGWWAQYMSSNDNKIVIAPNRWMRVDMPIDLYGDNWVLLDVSEYVDCVKRD